MRFPTEEKKHVLERNWPSVLWDKRFMITKMLDDERNFAKWKKKHSLLLEKLKQSSNHKPSKEGKRHFLWKDMIDLIKILKIKLNKTKEKS